jgi:hypothetical protein
MRPSVSFRFRFWYHLLRGYGHGRLRALVNAAKIVLGFAVPLSPTWWGWKHTIFVWRGHEPGRDLFER